MKSNKNLLFIFTSLLLITTLMISGCLNDINPGKPDITKGLVAHWTFDEESGNIVEDSSEFGINGTVYGARWTEGRIGGALDFDGIDDYVQIPNNESHPPNNLKNNDQGSISLWFKCDYIPIDNGVAPLFQYGSKHPCDVINNANGGLIIELGHDPLHKQSKRIYFTFFSHGCELHPSLCFDSNENLNEGEWYHFVAVVGYYKDIGYNTGYLNGKEIINRHYNFGNAFTAEFFQDAAMHESLFLGKGFWNKEVLYFDGIIDDVRIYDRPLSTEEINHLYHLE
jgi:hypothetical protein